MRILEVMKGWGGGKIDSSSSNVMYSRLQLLFEVTCERWLDKGNDNETAASNLSFQPKFPSYFSALSDLLVCNLLCSEVSSFSSSSSASSESSSTLHFVPCAAF
jgi:hypothetical protein